MPTLRRRTLSHVRSLDLSRRKNDEEERETPPPVPPLPSVPSGSGVPPIPTSVSDAASAQGHSRMTSTSTATATQRLPALQEMHNGLPNGTPDHQPTAGPSSPHRGHAYMPSSPNGTHDEVLQSGWLLKKGRKKLQGYARRYFTLTTHGVLSYGLSPSHPTRGSRALRAVSVAASGKLRQITIDGGVSLPVHTHPHQGLGGVGGVGAGAGRSADDEIWHLRTLTGEDWTWWMTAIRRFILVSDPSHPALSLSLIDAERRSLRSPVGSVRGVRGSTSLGALAARLGKGEEVGRGGRVGRMMGVLGGMERTLGEMEQLVGRMSEEGQADGRPQAPSPRRVQSFGIRGKKEGRDAAGGASSHSSSGREVNGKEKGKEGEREKEKIFGLFSRRASHKDHHSPTPSSQTTSIQSTSTSDTPTPTPTLSSRTTSSPTPSRAPSQQSTAYPPPPTAAAAAAAQSLAALSASLQALRTQHAQLLSILQEPASRAHSRPGTVHEHEHHSPIAILSSTAAAQAELEQGHISLNDPLSLSGGGGQKRLSLVTTASGGTAEEWFDADDWDGEEIDLDLLAAQAREEGGGGAGSEGESGSELEEEEEREEEREVARALERGEGEGGSESGSGSGSEDGVSWKEAEAEPSEPAGLGGVQKVAPGGGAVLPAAVEERRRTRLPATVSGEEVSLWAVLRKNVGKDLSTVSFPVTFNEPLSLLQKLAEEMEYADLLSKAAATPDPVERLCYIAAFAVSGYAHTHYRATRKPFNPMLGETFEDVRPGYRFIAEKVTHHPPVMASFAEDVAGRWTYAATSSAKNKFWGRSLEVIPVFIAHLKIGENNYQWGKPSSFMRNIMGGQKYIEHVGQMTITDSSPSGLTCTLEFKDAGFWGSSRNAVSGVVRSPDGAVLATLEGTWHESFSRQLDAQTLNVLWRANPMPAHAERYYGFTAFAIELNEILPSQAPFLPPTDSRFNPAQRALEEGRLDDAEAEKLRLEQAQRRRRKEREDMGKSWEPRWFARVPGTSGATEEWEFNGRYWDAREKRAWDDPGLW